MKVALIRYHDKNNINTRLPASLNKVRGELPFLGIAYIASYLEQNGHKVIIIDALAENITEGEFRSRLRDFSPELAGITAMTSTLRGSLEAARIAKDYGAKTVIGGAHLSAYPQETLSYDFLDFGIIGDGEVPMLKLIDALQGKGSFKDIKGLVYKENKNIINNGPFVLMDLDLIPPPAYHLLPLKKYSSIISSRRMTTMVTSRGCPYACGFCFTQPTDKFHRVISPATVVDTIEMLNNKYGIEEIMFYDDNITLNRGHIEKICSEIIRRELKIRWESPCRADTIDSDLLKMMAKSGCFRLRFGVESGNQEVLDLMKKNIKLETVKRSFELCKLSGIQTFAYFIIGYASESEKTVKETIRFAKNLNSDFAMFTVATAYPFTDLYELAVKTGILKGDYWRDFTLGREQERMPFFLEDSQKWAKRAYRSFYFRPTFILKKLSKANSPDAVKKMLIALKALVCFRN